MGCRGDDYNLIEPKLRESMLYFAKTWKNDKETSLVEIFPNQ